MQTIKTTLEFQWNEQINVTPIEGDTIITKETVKERS
jgi:hypothetical protein